MKNYLIIKKRLIFLYNYAIAACWWIC